MSELSHGPVIAGAVTASARPWLHLVRLKPKQLTFHHCDGFPGGHLLYGVQPRKLRNTDVPDHLSGSCIELDYPTCSPRGVIESLHAGPQHIANQLERIDPPEVRDLAEKFAVQVKFLDAA